MLLWKVRLLDMVLLWKVRLLDMVLLWKVRLLDMVILCVVVESETVRHGDPMCCWEVM